MVWNRCISIVVMTLIVLGYHLVSAQIGDTWIAFYNQDSTKIGYKDPYGKIKIEPKFASIVTAIKFDDIMGGIEEDGGEWESYYLNKDNRIFGKDSLYIYDNSVDCENEGFIRFRDRKTDKVGLFDKNGTMVVPALYDDLSKVRNGMLVARKGAKKKYVREEEPPIDNYYSWVGGEELLIDTSNKVLVKHFPFDDELNFYAVEQRSDPSSDSTKQTFLAYDGRYLSFIDYKREFEVWLKEEFLRDMSKKELLKSAHDSIIWESEQGWEKSESSRFVDHNFQRLQQILSEINDPQTRYSIFLNGLNPFMYSGKDFDKYFNNCGEPKAWQYPVLSVVISYDHKTEPLLQNHFYFLRTEHGYKLVSLSLTNEKI